ncbi:hypothetical protein HPB49_008862 [Dermacentor silvarum]|uniref:Uncharacterized protein n=1 Tax=Dermacentor silvarum TaxID=543639 RepID=A0ACB8DC82_DERSI|nr:hypothetical protein HPB49_008862 [Dermacentor silvarum]
MFKPCRSRSASVESAERSRTSGTIGAFFSEEEDGAAGYTESSMGAPPIIEDPAVIKIFGKDSRDNRKDCGIIERRRKGKKSTAPKLRTTRCSNHEENVLAGAAGTPKNSYRNRISGNGRNQSLARCEWMSRCPPSADIENNRSQIRQRQSRTRSSASRSKGRSVGKAIPSGKDKKCRKEEGSKHRRKVKAFAATLPSEELSPPSLSPPGRDHHSAAMSARERHKRAAVANVAPVRRMADQGDIGTTLKYKQVCNVIATTATPGDQCTCVMAVPMTIGDGEYSPLKPQPWWPRLAKKVTKSNLGRKVDTNGDERHASTTVKITPSEVAAMSENEAGSSLSEPAPCTVTGFVFVDPSTPVQQFRYTETAQSGYGGAGQQWRPHPLCPVHSPQSGGGQIPLSARYSMPPLEPALPAPTHYSANSCAAPWTWEQQQPLNYEELFYPPSGGSTVDDDQFYGEELAQGTWYPTQQQPPTVGWDGATTAGYTWCDGMLPNALLQPAAGPGAVPPTVLLPPASQWSAPFEQLLPQFHGQQGDSNLCHAQFAQSGVQQQPSPEGLDMSGSPSARTNDPLQIPSVLSDLGIASKWGRTVTESFEIVPRPQSTAKPTAQKNEVFFWSCQRAKPQSRRASRSSSDINASTRRASEAVPFHVCCHGNCHGRRSRNWSVPCVPQVATSLQECHAHGADLATHFINNGINAAQSAGPHACAMAACASCSHSPITVPVEVRITQQCSSSPTLYPTLVPSMVTTAPLVGGPSQPQLFEQKQSDEDMYLILPSKSGQDVLYHARHISPVLRLPSVQGVVETAGRQPYWGASAMPNASAEVGTWESEVQNAEAMKKKRDDSRHGLASRRSSMKSMQAAGQTLTANGPQKVSREPSKRASLASALDLDKLLTEPTENPVEAGEKLTSLTKQKQMPAKRVSDATELDVMFKSTRETVVDAVGLDKRSYTANRHELRSSRKPSLASGRRFLNRLELDSLKKGAETSEPGPASKRAFVDAGLNKKSTGQVEESSDISSARTERLGTEIVLQLTTLEPPSQDSTQNKSDAAVKETATVSVEHASRLESQKSSEIWRMAGLLIRRFGVITILEVSLGVKPDRTAGPTVELSYPRYLRIEDYSLGGVDTLRGAVLEAARHLGSSDDADNLVSQVMSVATTLATLAGNMTVRQVLFTEYEDVAVNMRTFIESVFGDGLRSDITVALREPHLLTDQLQALISTASVAAFINYLGFRVIVSFAALFNSNSAASLRSVLGAELVGHILPAEMNWLLCLRAVERVQPACVGKALAMQQAAAGISATNRLWLFELEDYFYKHLPRVAWMTDQSLKMIGDKLKRLYIVRAVDAASWKLCTLRPLKTLDEGSSLRMFVRAAGEYQRERLHQINKPSRPLDPGPVFDVHSRYSDALQTVYVPVGLINSSAVAKGQLQAFHAARMAVRFYKGLLPVAYEQWDSNLPDTEAPWVLNAPSRRSLDRLLECFASDFRIMSSLSFSSWVPVIREAAEDRYPLLAQTTALALAYSTFKELLRAKYHQRLDFRLQSLSDVSSEQLFFMYYALDNCESTDEIYQAMQFRTRGRLPAEYRVNLPLRHLPQFARAFRCSDSYATSTAEGQRQQMVAPERSRCDVMRWNSTVVPGGANWYRRLTQVRAKSFGGRRDSGAPADRRAGERAPVSFSGRAWMIAGRDDDAAARRWSS